VGWGCGAGGRDNLTNVQCKAIGNWHNEYPLYNGHMIIKMKIREKQQLRRHRHLEIIKYNPNFKEFMMFRETNTQQVNAIMLR
jgi:hypothetical protein